MALDKRLRRALERPRVEDPSKPGSEKVSDLSFGLIMLSRVLELLPLKVCDER